MADPQHRNVIETQVLGGFDPAMTGDYAPADNRLAELAGWDRDILATELQALIDLNFEIEFTGFDVGEADIILNDADADRGESADPSECVASGRASAALRRCRGPGRLYFCRHHHPALAKPDPQSGTTCPHR